MTRKRSSSGEFDPSVDGMARASKHIAVALSQSRNTAILLVYVHGLERLCANLGHARTRQALDGFHRQLKGIVRDREAVEQLSDRKFVVMLTELRNLGHARLAAEKIHRLSEAFDDREHTLGRLRLTIGVVLAPDQGREPEDLLRSAEIALLDGRRRNQSVSFYESRAADRLVADWDMEGRLSRALAHGELELYYQPKLCLATGGIAGAEALMRWHDDDSGQISPEVFISLAEDTGQIVELTHFAVQRACRQLNQWFEALQGFNVAVNFTPSIIQDQEIVDELASACAIWDINAGGLTIEVTENALMADRDMSHKVLTRIRELGARVSIDDFGTGYSSLSYLKEIPADELKIDRSFVMGMRSDSDDRKIVEHTVAMARSFGLSVVAEGVEDEDTLDELRSFGCNYAQGYHICKPLPAEEFLEWYRSRPRPGVGPRPSL